MTGVQAVAFARLCAARPSSPLSRLNPEQTGESAVYEYMHSFQPLHFL